MNSEEQSGCLKMRIIEYHDYRTLMGPCFVSFSLPLLVPGVVLTVVGSYGNEHTFETFGGWHITGIVILIIASLMLIVGIFLKCFFRPVVSADLEEHLTPSSSMITGKKNLGYERDIYTNSNNSVGRNNKVSPTPSDDKDQRHVSTHEAKDNSSRPAGRSKLGASDGNTSNTDGVSRAGPLNSSGNKGQSLDYRDSAYSASTSAQSKHSPIMQSDIPRGVSDPVPAPPIYQDTVEERKLRRKHSKKKIRETENAEPQYTTTETPHGTVRTSVTARFDASVEQTNEIQNEQQDFSEKHDKKRKKKKRKRRDSRTLPDDNSLTSHGDPTVNTLPELRVRPVLVHEGNPHHHHDLHVHFNADSDDAINQPLNVRESQDFES